MAVPKSKIINKKSYIQWQKKHKVIAANESATTPLKKTHALVKSNFAIQFLRAKKEEKDNLNLVRTYFLKTYTALIFFYHIIFVSSLFWLLSLVGHNFYARENSLNKVSNYECGFDNTTPATYNTSNQLMAVAVFLLIYDAELLFALPMFFSIMHTWTTTSLVLFLIIVFIFVSCLWDTVCNVTLFGRP